MCTNEKLRCPFVYSTGKRCDGHIVRVKAYGPKRDGKTDIRKLRVWCAPKWDHAGTVSSYVSKDRMEFYPDQLPSDVRDDIMSLFDKGRHGISVEA